MGRFIIQIARIRATDAQVGDVINRDHEATTGWFVLRQVDRLHDGKINLSDGGVNNSFALFPVDTIGLQIAKNVQVETQPELPHVPIVGGEVIIGAENDETADTDADDPNMLAEERAERRRPTTQGTREAARPN